MRRRVTIVTKFLDHNNRELKQRRRRQQQERRKSNKFTQQNNNFARASRFFVHFLAAVARVRRETS